MKFSGSFLTLLFKNSFFKIKMFLKKTNPFGNLNRIGAKGQRIFKRSEINYKKINANNYSIIFTRI